jgi:hypothetical protein
VGQSRQNCRIRAILSSTTSAPTARSRAGRSPPLNPSVTTSPRRRSSSLAVNRFRRTLSAPPNPVVDWTNKKSL